MFDGKGNLYGTTALGGPEAHCPGGCGTVFELSPPSQQGGPWTRATLYQFLGQADGGAPGGGVILDKAGNLYGTASKGGDEAGDGVVFELTNDSGTWSETVIYMFSQSTNMWHPNGGLAIGGTGELYGTTFSGGDPDACPYPTTCGAVFALAPPNQNGGRWSGHPLHLFSGPPDGSKPIGPLYLSGNALYGVTEYGGGKNSRRCADSFGCGVAFGISF